MDANLIIWILRLIFSAIDNIIYWAIGIVYELLFNIASTTMTEDVLNSLGNNIYAILGVIMLFKVAFSLITYILNPDQFTDKNAGFGAIIKNIFVVMVLILFVPIVFRQAMNLQRIILKEDILGRVVTGVSKADITSDNEKAGKNIALNLLSGFIRPNEELFPECKDIMNTQSENYTQCITAISNKNSKAATAYKEAMGEGDKPAQPSKLLSYSVITSTGKDTSGEKIYLFDYTFLVSSLVGGFTAYILLGFCIDVAVRTIKFIFLRLISPIPIAAYIDPKGQKGAFNKWTNTCLKTYADLFLRLAAIYFAVFIIENVLLKPKQLYVYGKESGPGFFVIIFLILGCLIFAKQLPGLIKDITGVDMGGKFTLNPLKKIENEALFGKQVSSGLAFTGRTARNAALAAGSAIGATAGWALGKTGLPDKMKDLGAGINGLAPVQAIRNFGNGVANDVRKIGNDIANSELGKAIGKSDVGTYFGTIGADAQGTFGSMFDFGKDKIEGMKKVVSSSDNWKKKLISDAENGKAKIQRRDGSIRDFSAELRKMQEEYNVAGRMSATEWASASNPYSYDEHGNFVDQATWLANKKNEVEIFKNKTIPEEYMKELMANGFVDDKGKDRQDLRDEYAQYERDARANGVEVQTTIDGMKDQSDKLSHEINEYNRKRAAAQQATGNKK